MLITSSKKSFTYLLEDILEKNVYILSHIHMKKNISCIYIIFLSIIYYILTCILLCILHIMHVYSFTNSLQLEFWNHGVGIIYDKEFTRSCLNHT